MKRLAYTFTVCFISFSLYACSSIDGDAKKAAELNKESIECAKKADLKKAEKLYKESQEIISRYKNTEQYKEFNDTYTQYLLNELSEK